MGEEEEEEKNVFCTQLDFENLGFSTQSDDLGGGARAKTATTHDFFCSFDILMIKQRKNVSKYQSCLKSSAKFSLLHIIVKSCCFLKFMDFSFYLADCTAKIS